MWAVWLFCLLWTGLIGEVFPECEQPLSGVETTAAYGLGSTRTSNIRNVARPNFTMPEIREITVCVWARLTWKRTNWNGTFFTCSHAQNRTKFMRTTIRTPSSLSDESEFGIAIGNEIMYTRIADDQIYDSQWHSYCSTWESTEGKARVYFDKQLKQSWSERQVGFIIPEGARIAIANRIGYSGGLFYSYAFHGVIGAVNVWPEFSETADILFRSNCWSVGTAYRLNWAELTRTEYAPTLRVNGFCQYGGVSSNCLYTADGHGYSGKVNSVNGQSCQNWADFDWLIDQDFPMDGSSKANASNYCRNPDGRSTGPWCYIEGTPTTCNRIPLCRNLVEGATATTSASNTSQVLTDGDFENYESSTNGGVLEIDMVDSHLVKAVVLHSVTDNAPDSTYNSTWEMQVAVVSRDGYATICNTNAEVWRFQNAYILRCSQVLEGNLIRISTDSGSAVHLTEVQVYGKNLTAEIEEGCSVYSLGNHDADDCPPLELFNETRTITEHSSDSAIRAEVLYECSGEWAIVAPKPFRQCVLDDTEQRLKWNGQIPHCEVIPRDRCNRHPDPYFNGTVEITSNEYKATARYLCPEHHVLKPESTPTERECLLNTEQWRLGWTGETDSPYCQEVPSGECTDYLPFNGTKAVSGYAEGDTVTYSCLPHYQVTPWESQVRYCVDNGNRLAWNGTDPYCELIPTTVCTNRIEFNGTWEVDTYEAGGKITYSCPENFEVTPWASTERTCVKSDGWMAWDGDQPHCSAIATDLCTERLTVEGGHVTVHGRHHGDIATYSCGDPSQAHLLGSATRVCNILEGIAPFWTGNPPTCAERQENECRTNLSLTHGTVTIEGYEVGSHAHYACDSGYQLANSIWPTRVCEAVEDERAWNGSGTDYGCEVIPVCLLPSGFLGTYYVTGLNEGGTITYGCPEGQELTSESTAQRECVQAGEGLAWTATEPSCGPFIGCPPIEDFDGTVSYDGNRRENTHVDHQCYEGYEVEPQSAARRTCISTVNEENAFEWDGEAASCTPKRCGMSVTQVENARHEQVEEDTYGSHIVYTCIQGYSFEYDEGAQEYVKSKTIECQASGHWTNAPTACQIDVCPALPTLENGSYDNTACTVGEDHERPFGTACTPSCETSYRQTQTNAHKVCLTGGVWLNADTLPVCGDATAPTFENGCPANLEIFVQNNRSALDNLEVNPEQESGVANWTHPTGTDSNTVDPVRIVYSVENLRTGETTSHTAENDGAMTEHTLFWGENQVTYTVYDSSNVSGSCSFTINVRRIPKCPVLSPPTNGAVNFGWRQRSSTAVYSCDENHYLDPQDGDRRECLVEETSGNLTWDGEAPSCIATTCPQPDVLSDGSYDETECQNGALQVNAVCTLTCNEGFEASNSAIRCSDDATWEDSNSQQSASPVCRDAIRPTVDSCPLGREFFYDNTVPGRTEASWTEPTATDNTGAIQRVTLTMLNVQNNESRTEVRNNDGGTVAYELEPGTSIMTYRFEDEEGLFVECDINITVQAIQRCPASEPDIYVTYNGSQASYSCPIGYILVPEGATRTCRQLNNGSYAWIGETPRCEAVSCGDPPEVANAIVSLQSSTFMSVATYSCLTGHVFEVLEETRKRNAPRYGVSAKTRFVTCTLEGNWEDFIGSCSVVRCTALASFDNGIYSSDSCTSDEGPEYKTTCNPICDRGFTLQEGAAHNLCTSRGEWLVDSSTTPRCELTGVARCTSQVEFNGTSVMNGTQEGDQLTHQCPDQYTLHPSESRTRYCQSNGVGGVEWSAETPTCLVTQCGEPPAVNNTIMTHTGEGHRSTAAYSCEHGFTHEDGSLRFIQCQATGQWETPPTPCVVAQCEPLGNFSNGQFLTSGAVDTDCSSGNRFAVGTACEPRCHTGYTLATPHVHMVCLATGVWLNEAAEVSCRESNTVSCMEPSHFNGTIDGLDEEPRENSTITYSCQEGYAVEPSDSETRRCVANGEGLLEWSGSDPQCNVVQCGPAPEPTEFASLLNDPSTEYLSKAVYKCQDGYAFATNATERDYAPFKYVTCLASGSWEDSPATCTEITCPQLPRYANGWYEPASCNNASHPQTRHTACTPVCREFWFDDEDNKQKICKEDGTWLNSDITPNCLVNQGVACPNDCPKPAKFNGAYEIITTGGAVSARYYCGDGTELVPASSATRNCTNSTWEGPDPYCRELGCDPPSTPVENAEIIYDGSRNDTAAYKCHDGYSFPDSSKLHMVRCNWQRNWEFIPPACQQDTCAPFSLHSNGVVEPAVCTGDGRVPSGTICVLGCVDGYEASPDYIGRTCLDGGVMANMFLSMTCTDNEAPVVQECSEGQQIAIANYSNDAMTEVQWQEPEAVDSTGLPPTVQITVTTEAGQVDPGNLGEGGDRHVTLPVGETRVSYRFRDQSDNENFCNFNITISDLPRCPVPNSIAGEIEYTLGTRLVGDEISYTCRENTFLSPTESATRQCYQIDGGEPRWYGEEPTCLPIVCQPPARPIFGSFSSEDCFTGPLTFGDECDPTCSEDDGFSFPGEAFSIECFDNSTWINRADDSEWIGLECIDSRAPIVQNCPDNIQLTVNPRNASGEDQPTWAVHWRDPSATDNANGRVNVTVSVNESTVLNSTDLLTYQTFRLGQHHNLPRGRSDIEYEFSDESGNTATCSIVVTINHPKVCMDPPELETFEGDIEFNGRHIGAMAAYFCPYGTVQDPSNKRLIRICENGPNGPSWNGTDISCEEDEL